MLAVLTEDPLYLERDGKMSNNTWTPIYSGTTHKLIAGVRENIIYIFIENNYSQDGGSWAQIGCIEGNSVYGGSGASKQLIGEIEIRNGDYCCIINRNESINISRNYCENGITEYKEKGFAIDYYENRLIALKKVMPRILVARVYERENNKFSAVHIYEAGENYVDEGRFHDVIEYAKAEYQDQNASPYALAAAFLAIQYHPTFDDVDRPLKCLWNF